MKAVVEEAVAEYGKLDVMFANAGIVGTNQHFLDVSSEDFMKTMRTNVLRQVIESSSRCRSSQEDQIVNNPATDFKSSFM